MQAGNLRHRINIEQQTGTADGYGNTLVGWSALYSSVPAEVLPLSSRELWAGEQSKVNATHRIKLRYLPGITTKMRVVFGSRVFTITGIIDPEERNISLELLTQEEVA